jgi:hypothetical protein
MNNDIDRVIDDVARELTAGEPDGAFKARVLARIESGESVRRNWRAAWIIAPLAAAALIAIAITWSHRDVRPKPSAEVGALHPSSQTAASRTENLEPRTTNPESRIPNPKSRILRLRSPELSRAMADPSEAPQARRRANPVSDVAVLAPPSLTVDSIALAPIAAGDSLQLPQLDTPASLDIAPLENPRTENQNENPEP